VVANINDNTISLLLGNGLGGFMLQTTTKVGTSPVPVAVGDFNGDGKLDVVTANESSGTLTILLGDGLGGFNEAPGSPIGVGGMPSFLAVGNIDGTGNLDIAVTNVVQGTTVLLGDGLGGFTPTPDSPFGAPALSVVLGDFNNDGKLDMALNNNSAVGVLLGDGMGGFTQGQTTPNPQSSGSIGTMATGDFNGDGKLDLVVDYNQSVSLLLGDGMGALTTAPGSPFGAGNAPLTVAVGDFDNNGKLDLATANSQDGNVTVLLGGLFTPTPVLTASPGSTIALGGSVTLTLAIAGGFTAPTGSVLFTADGTAQPAVNLSLLGTAVFTASNLGVGPHTFQASYSGDPNYNPASSNTLSIMVVPNSQTITFGALPPSQVFGAPAITVSATGGASGNAVTFTSLTPGVCTATGTNGATVTAIGAGMCTIQANQAGSATYGAATAVNQSFPVSPAQQTILFAPLSNQTFGAAPVMVSATVGVQAPSMVSSGLAASFSSSPTGVCTTSGTTVTLIATGTCTVQASVPGNANYLGAAMPQSFTVLAAQTIAFGAISTHVSGTAAFALNASASSGFTVAFASNSTGVCTVSGAMSGAIVTLVAAGTCSITATQPGDNVTYGPATPVTVTFTVDPPFTDLGDQTANEIAAINLMASFGITSGCSTTPFEYCPDLTVTRAQMAVFIIRSIFGSNDFTYTTMPYFPGDVPAGAPNFKYIQKMKDLSITSGETATTYGPNDPVTRGEMAVFIIRARYGTGFPFNYTQAPYFTDVPAGTQFQYIQKMKDVGITSGETATTYGPGDPVTRGEMALFVIRGAFDLLLPSVPGPPSAPAPVVTSVSPNSGTPGATVNVTITGANTHFVQGTTAVASGAAITAQNVTVTSSTSLTAQLVVAANAKIGPATLVVTTGTEEAALPNGFTITSDPASGVIAYFTGNGTTVDSVSSQSGTLVNGATYASATSRTQGVLDAQAFSLNGTNSYVQAASGETGTVSGARTLAAWVYAIPFTGPGEPILTGGSTVSVNDIFGITGNVTGTPGTCGTGVPYQLYVDFAGTACYVSDISLAPGAWSFVAVTFDGSNVVFFINGVASVTVPGAQMSNYGLATLEIGGNTLGDPSSGMSFNGLLSEVQVYNRALTPAEIQGLYSP